jgi:hypothetical protein
MAINEKYSFGDFTGQDLSSEPPEDFNGDIVGSCFYQENAPDSEIFPSGITSIFKRCNLDNVKIPAGATVQSESGIDSSSRKINIQNDLEDWVLDESLNPVEPINKKQFQDLGLSIDPNDIPAEKRTGESVTQEKERLLAEA